MSEQQQLENRREQIRTAVLSTIARRRRARQRRAIGILAGGALLLAAGVGLGAARLVTLTPGQQTMQDMICYLSDDTSRPQYVVNADPTALDVVTICRDLWERGNIGQTPAPDDPNDMTAHYPVPKIAVCRDNDGYVSGFPIWGGAETPEQLCDRLGLPVVELP